MTLLGVARADESKVLELAVETARRVVAREPFAHALTDTCARLLDADRGSGYTQLAWHASEATIAVTTSPHLRFPAAQARRAAPHVSGNPGMSALVRSGARDVVRTSDLVEMEEFWETPAFATFHGWIPGARYPAGAALCVEDGVLVFLGLHRSDRDFTEEDLRALRLLQHVVAPAVTHRVRLDRATDRLIELGVLERPGAGILTPRETDVLSLAALGLTSAAIGRRLGITERGVRKHLTAVYSKTGCNGRAAAAAWWTSRGRNG